MRRPKLISIRAVAIAAIAFGVAGEWAEARAAQEAPASPPGNAGPLRAGRGGRIGRPPLPTNPDRMTVQQVEQYFDQVVLYQAQSQLQLSDDQFLKFGAGLRRLQTARRQQQRRRLMLIRDLNALITAPTLDDVAVTTKVKEIDDLTTEANREVQEAYGAIDTALNVRQRARFRIFEEMMERRKIDLLSRARRAAAGDPQGAPPVR
jgi:hypothetical protein